MANNQPHHQHQHHHEGLGDEFFEQILSVPNYNTGGNDSGGGFVGGGGPGGDGPSSILLGLGPGDGSGHGGVNVGLGIGGFRTGMGMGLGLPLGLNLDHGSSSTHGGVDGGNTSSSRINENDTMHLTNLFPAFSHQIQHQSLRPSPPLQVHQVY